MTDEVFSDNLDEASKADTEAAAAVEALPAEGEAVQAVAADQATDEQAQSEQDAPEEQTAETTEDEDTEQDAGAKAVEEFSKSLRTLEGKWYVLHTYSGYEKRVKTNVESRVASFGMEDKIFQVEVPMEEVEKHTEKGKKIITLEGLTGPNGELSDIQQAFVDEAAIQCGFCTPGFILTAVEILESGREYSDDELRKLLSGHLCRCTGYENILRAVKKTMRRRLGKN